MNKPYLTIVLSILLVLTFGLDHIFASSGQRELDLDVGTRYFSKKSLGSPNDFSRPSIPYFGFKALLYRFDFGLEPLFGFNAQVASSKRSGGLKSKYQLYQIQAGARYNFWSRDFFPLTTFVEAAATCSVMTFKTESSSAETNSDGAELGIKAGGGLKLSFVSMNSKLENEVKNTWNLKDYGFIVDLHYYPGGIFRAGSFKNLSSISHLAGGGGLYFSW